MKTPNNPQLHLLSADEMERLVATGTLRAIRQGLVEAGLRVLAPSWLTIAQVEELTGWNRNRILALRNQGYLKDVSPDSRSVRIERRSVEELLSKMDK